MAKMKKMAKNGTSNQDQPTNGKTKDLESSDRTENPSTIKSDHGTAFRALPLTVRSQYLKDLSFESPAAPEIFLSLKQVPEIVIDVGVKTTELANNGPLLHEVTISIVATAYHEKEVVFICEVIYAGLFVLGELPAEIVQPVLNIECPRILFPFMRSIIGEVTGNAGFPPLMINPIDFSAVYQKKRREHPSTGS